MWFKPLFLASLLGLALSQTHSGDATFTDFGLGSCGFTNNDSQMVTGVSTAFFNDFPGAGPNPNDNPICNKTITATFNKTTIQVQIVDKCTGCGMFDLNLSPTAFGKFAKTSVGRIHNVSWSVNGGGE